VENSPVFFAGKNLGEQIQTVYGDTYGPLRLDYSQESSPLCTAGALRLAEPLFGSDSIFVMNGDSVCCADFTDFWMWQGERNADAPLLLAKVSDAFCLQTGR